MGFVINFIRFQQCKKFENRLRFDRVTESLMVRTVFETQCIYLQFRVKNANNKEL